MAFWDDKLVKYNYMNRWLIIGVVVFLVISGVVVYSIFFKSHRSVADEVAIQISATELFDRFETNETEMNSLYLDKVIEVNGEVSEIIFNQDGRTVIILATSSPMFGVNCTMEGDSEGIEVGSIVSIKGICIGYLSDVVINRAIIIKKEPISLRQ
jgi:hypothetical protein